MGVRYFLFIIISLLLSSCELFDPAEKTPSYIHIENISFSAKPEDGSSSNKISDAWVYVDDQLIGAFELPATLPVLMDGKHNLTIKPGIKINGISDTRAIYQFYTPYSIPVNLIPDSVLSVNPNSTYTVSSVLAWKEAFEDGGMTLEKTYRSDTTLNKTSDFTKKFEGDYSGIINLDASHDFFECKTSSSYVLPKNGSAVFLEMNYRTDVSFSVGVFANNTGMSTQHEILIVNPSPTWNKIYINLTGRVSQETDADSFQIFIAAVKPGNIDKAEILFDNLKLIHF